MVKGLAMHQSSQIVVIGLGNPVLTDDGVGIQVARAVKARLAELDCQADVIEAYSGGLSLMESMTGYKKAIIIDAMITGQLVPGTFRCLELSHVFQTKNSMSVHDLDLPSALEIGKALGLLLPGEIKIWGIEALNIDEFSETLSPEVSKAVPIVTNLVLANILE